MIPRMMVLLNIYRMIPAKSNCIGKCQAFCGPVPISNTEYEYIPEHLRKPRPDYDIGHRQTKAREQAFYNNRPIPEPACAYLVQGKCSIYEYRPMVCRTWGSNGNAMNKCPFGCKPTLDDETFDNIMKLYVMLIELDDSAKQFLSNKK